MSKLEDGTEDKNLEIPLISISIPVLNEAANLDTLYERLCGLDGLMAGKCKLEFVFSDNHSNDTTWEKLTALAAKDPRVKAIRFSKNFGFQRSILANYLHTSGDAIMQIDADLQDPPEMLETFFEQWKQGYLVIYGIRAKRKESLMMNKFREFGYWAIDKISEHPIPRNAGDFRLIDRKVVTALSRMRASNPYLRGMIANLGFKQIGIPYSREARLAGYSKFNLVRLVRLGLTAVFNHSSVPLRFASFAGLIMLATSILGGIYYLFLRILHPDLPQGLASIHILVFFGIGLNSILLGVIGEYLLRIYLILRADPVAVIEHSLNFADAELKF